MKRWTIAVLSIAALAADLGLPISASARPPVDRLVFASNQAGTFDLYEIKADGTGLRPLFEEGPDDSFDEYEADVSPDGRRIVFVRSITISCCGPTQDIYIANIDGTDVRPLTPPDRAVDDYRPQWSPNGKRIAFSRGTGGGSPSNIYTVRPDGSGLKQLTDAPGGNSFPTWSPDGSQLVFGSTRRGALEIWIMDATGDRQRPITERPDGLSPQWSPAGDQIVFRSLRDGGVADELYTVRSDGTGLTRLTTDSDAALAPTWSSDGRHIAFVSFRDVPCISVYCPAQLWIMDADGSNARRITEAPFAAAFPDYFPRRSS